MSTTPFSTIYTKQNLITNHLLLFFLAETGEKQKENVPEDCPIQDAPYSHCTFRVRANSLSQKQHPKREVPWKVNNFCFSIPGAPNISRIITHMEKFSTAHLYSKYYEAYRDG